MKFIIFILFIYQIVLAEETENSLMQACGKRDLVACEKLGAFYLSKSDWERTLIVGETLCEKDLPTGCTFAGSALLGLGKIKEANQFLIKACDKFEPYGCRSLGRLMKKNG